MKLSLYPVAFFTIAIVILSCTHYTKKTLHSETKDTVHYESAAILDSFELLGQTISIEARFSECGEWGGHKEKIIVNVDREQMKVFANYKVYPFNCDSMPSYEGRENLKPILDKRI